MGMIMHHFSTNLENEVFIHRDLVKTQKQGWIASEILAGMWLTYLSEKNIKDEYSKYQGRVPLMQAAETSFILYLLCILLWVLNSGGFAHLDISFCVVIHLFLSFYTAENTMSTVFFCGSIGLGSLILILNFLIWKIASVTCVILKQKSCLFSESWDCACCRMSCVLSH